MVSIIIPTYNRKLLLAETLKNILQQTRTPDEIIVVDDHSTDGTLAYLSRHYPEVVTVLNYGKGPGAARNTGLKLAKGEYIKFFDSDDIMSLNSLEIQLSVLMNSGSDMVYSPYVYASFEGHQWIQKDVILQYKPIPQHRTLHDCMVYGFFTVIPSMMFTRTFLEKVGPWREDLVAYEDWDYLWRIGSLISNPSHTHQCLMIYRLHGQQTTLGASNDLSRDRDKCKCLTDIISNSSLSPWKRYLLTCEVEKTKHRINVSRRTPFYLHLGLLWKRIRNKIERFATKSAWERHHGINQSPGLFHHHFHII